MDEGQPAHTIGTLVAFAGFFHVRSDDAARIAVAHVGSATELVRLQVPPSLDLSQFEGERVSVTGRWIDKRLTIDSRNDIMRHAASSHLGSPPVETWDGTVRPRPRVERVLMEQGLLLGRWETRDADSGEPRQIALSTDVGAVKNALDGLYGDALQVVQSRWSAELLDEIEIAATWDEDLVQSVGRELGEGDQLRIAVTLLHLNTPTAIRLDPYPADAIALKVLVKPGASGSP